MRVLVTILWCKIFIVSLLLKTTVSTRLPKFCQKPRPKAKPCVPKSNPEGMTCRENLSYDDHFSGAKVIFSCAWTLDHINPEQIINHFRSVQRLTIRNGNVTEFSTDFPKSKHLHHLVLADLNLREVRKSLFAALENLEWLDLSHNRLKHFPPEIIKTHPSLLKVLLIGNPWNCSSDLKWILDKTINSKLANKNLLQCGGDVYPGKPVYFVMSLIKKMEKDCPSHVCSCSMSNIVWDTGQNYLVPVITVNCTDRGLTRLPSKLPTNTTSLLFSRNNISNLHPLVHNKGYRNIADIYLDYNQVRSVDVLEGALWLKTFRVFSLKGNLLTQLPIYALDNAFEKNTNMAKIYLGHNPWKCDCLFIPEFQHLLIKYGSVIKDKNDIKCAEDKNKDNSNKQIVSLSMNSVCRKPDGGTNPLDILSIIFACLIVLVLGKLLFDYCTFKRTGKLPWIVTKMP